MSLYNGPARGGTRGGKDQFSWENVKSDQHREFYLGHSVKASVGRWQKGKDILWYTKQKENAGDIEEQRKRIKAFEDQMMDEALGIRPKKKSQLPLMGMKQAEQLLKSGNSGGEFEDARGLGVGRQTGSGDVLTRDVLRGSGQPGNSSDAEQDRGNREPASSSDHARSPAHKHKHKHKHKKHKSDKKHKKHKSSKRSKHKHEKRDDAERSTYTARGQSGARRGANEGGGAGGNASAEQWDKGGGGGGTRLHHLVHTPLPR